MSLEPQKPPLEECIEEGEDFSYKDITDEDDLYDWEIEYLLEVKE